MANVKGEHTVVSPADAARQVAHDNNNPTIEGWTRIVLEMVERSGIVLVARKARR